MDSIETLLKAAEYLDRRDREHGYASMMPMPVTMNVSSRGRASSKRMVKQRKSQGIRSTHNELEKNRRAHLRNCLERLKEIVPLAPDSNKHTTLGLLVDARILIKCLEEKEKQLLTIKNNLMKDRNDILRMQSPEMMRWYRSRSEHTISESSSASGRSSSSYGNDEVDVTSCSGSGGLSDLDDSEGSIINGVGTIIKL